MECLKKADRAQHRAAAETTLRVEINAQTMQHLLAQNILCAQDFRCLDRVSKRCVHRLFLNNCALCVATGDGV